MKHLIHLLLCLHLASSCFAKELTAYKFSGKEMDEGLPEYTIPSSSIYKVSRAEEQAPPITFYYTPPSKEHFPIAIFCTGSSLKNTLYSVIHVHRYFLDEFESIGAGLITLEQWGMNENSIDAEIFLWSTTPSLNALVIIPLLLMTLYPTHQKGGMGSLFLSVFLKEAL